MQFTLCNSPWLYPCSGEIFALVMLLGHIYVLDRLLMGRLPAIAGLVTWKERTIE